MCVTSSLSQVWVSLFVGLFFFSFVLNEMYLVEMVMVASDWEVLWGGDKDIE